jgi:hypothetical protein
VTLPASGVLANGYTDAGNILTLPSSATIDGSEGFAATGWGGYPVCGIRVINGLTFQVGDVTTGVSKTDSQSLVFNNILFGLDAVE